MQAIEIAHPTERDLIETTERYAGEVVMASESTGTRYIVTVSWNGRKVRWFRLDAEADEQNARAIANVTAHHNGHPIRYESSVSGLVSLPQAIRLLDPFQAPGAVGCVELPAGLLVLRGI